MPHPSVSVTPFGAVPGLGAASLYTLRQKSGTTVTLADYGATWVGWLTPDREGRFADILLGFDSAEGFARHTAYAGATCGRHANRIAKGRCTVDGRELRLAVNNGPNHLHGGEAGFDRRLWSATVGGSPEAPCVTFSRRSPAGEEGYPGNLDVSVAYTLLPDDAVKIEYHATTDAPTVLNLTNHAYFNLAGHDSGDCLAHRLRLHSGLYLPTDETAIPTGEIASVAGTPFDFRESRLIGARINEKHPQLGYGRGYDHCFVIDGAPETLRPAATLTHPASGRVLEVETTEPGLQVYTGNWLAECCEGVPGKGGAPYRMRSGVALETQRLPDSPNRPAFRGVLLRPGETFRSATVYRARQAGA